MNTLVLLLISIAVLFCGYVFYGSWIARQWGVNEGNRPTPAHTMEDGVDYVPAKAPILMGHHFSSIAGAGPITGPIGAAMFGWLPVTLWVLVGGIFFGGVHDFGALFASIRHQGKSIGEIISLNMSKRAKQLFIIFSYLTLILVVAAFAAIVASTFGATYKDGVLDMAASATKASVAMVSIMFILIAIVFGFAVYRRHTPMVISSILGVGAIVLCMAVGMNYHPFYFSTSTWMFLVGIYITIASVTPVWILLQPRDYLSSFLLYAMLIVAVIGIVGAHPTIDEKVFPASPASPSITQTERNFSSRFCSLPSHAALFPASTPLFLQGQHPSSLIKNLMPSLSLMAACSWNAYSPSLPSAQSAMPASQAIPTARQISLPAGSPPWSLPFRDLKD